MYPSSRTRSSMAGAIPGSMWSLLVAALLFFAQAAPPAQAQSGQAWRIDYYPNREWSGAPVYTDYANVVDFNWRSAAPGPRVPDTNWTARLTSKAFFYAGLYRLTLIADDEVVLGVDGMTFFDTLGQGQSGKAFVLDLPMTQGVHEVHLDYRQATGQAYVSLDWQFVKNGLEVLPGFMGGETVVTPLVTRYGDYTRCLQQGLHQSHCFQADGRWGSPSLGMIQMEAPVVVWDVCVGGAVQTRQLLPDRPAQAAQCSRSEAGWFAK